MSKDKGSTKESRGTFVTIPSAKALGKELAAHLQSTVKAAEGLTAISGKKAAKARARVESAATEAIEALQKLVDASRAAVAPTPAEGSAPADAQVASPTPRKAASPTRPAVSQQSSAATRSRVAKTAPARQPAAARTRSASNSTSAGTSSTRARSASSGTPTGTSSRAPRKRAT